MFRLVSGTQICSRPWQSQTPCRQASKQVCPEDPCLLCQGYAIRMLRELYMKNVGLTGLIARWTMDLKDCSGCFPKSIASRRPLTELASRRDLLRCETLCKGALEAEKLRYSVQRIMKPQNEACLRDRKLAVGIRTLPLLLARCGAERLRSILVYLSFIVLYMR